MGFRLRQLDWATSCLATSLSSKGLFWIVFILMSGKCCVSCHTDHLWVLRVLIYMVDWATMESIALPKHLQKLEKLFLKILSFYCLGNKAATLHHKDYNEHFHPYWSNVASINSLMNHKWNLAIVTLP